MFKVYRNISEALTLESANKKQGRKISEKDLSLVKNAVVVSRKKKIVWVGSEKKFSLSAQKKLGLNSKNNQEFDMRKNCVLPGFVDCHSHAVFAGSRSNEFEQRNQGVSYQEIARKGGGILSTVKSTRKVKKENLQEITQERVNRFYKQGVTTLEVKTGYGLSLNSERKLLEVIRSLKKIHIVSTFLGPHAVPPEFSESSEYMSYLLVKVLPPLLKKNFFDRADIFLENGYFKKEDYQAYFNLMAKNNKGLTAHIDQLTRSGLVGELCKNPSVQSLDHLVQINKKDIDSIAKSHVTAVLLPLADFYLKMKYPPARALLDQGAKVALASDFNPGSAPSQSIPLVGLLARLEMKMTLPEVISSFTLGGASALGLSANRGSLTVGKDCHLVSYACNWDQLFYDPSFHPVRKVVC